ncbi:MAG TPA: leucyl/phenylalanyl-tRNA--protein transferase [Gammaproteobacteria bacterium]|nr:leucyl/phenylalanyl-tRNA--protein transferase [Gammaproteobacteria bacterium]
MPQLAWIRPDDPPDTFPDPRGALREPDGLLAAGGDLSPARLLYAYRHGIFPWYSAGQPILWWCPDPRAVLFPDALHISHSLRKTLRKADYRVTLDCAFPDVIRGCAATLRGNSAPGTWITPEMQLAYTELHRLGHAHSVEVWADGKLVGGVYGVSMGRVFFGESMFSRQANASKIALAWLTRQLSAWHYKVMDCQVASPHLERLGSTLISRTEFLSLLDRHASMDGHTGRWQFDISPVF